MAKLMASGQFNSLQSVTKRVTLRPEALRLSFHLQLLAVLHECAHAILEHPKSSRQIRSTDGVIENSRLYDHELEYAAGSFAVASFLNLDEEVRQEWAFEVALACTVLYGFGHLVSGYVEHSDGNHPSFTYRWTNVRSQFVDALGSEMVLKRFEGIIEALTAMQHYSSKEQL
jgi:hypothetical protein